ncbi:polysaccharide deacetylase family protein [Virgibacillus sp. C22-A2]|uniref:Polysaccharide deacetylase family protein n=1 Tax=Virgibacillus tibetensis TaxID=3042313 RepID=A0ABU6KD48_9BACI|nr:polysaccharide deacetylase family protein [Virgibacillus sp. C22-A2]
MKRIISILLLLFLVFLAACTDGEEEDKEIISSPKDQEETHEDDQAQQSTEEDDKERSETESAEPVDKIQEEPKYEIAEDWSITPINGQANEQVVLLTIDDAPDDYAVEMANTLKELDVNAIFFVNGHFLNTPEDEEKLREIHEMGFVIGNHTYSHPNLREISEEEQTEEIISLSDRVEEIIGERPLFFRAPHGANTDHSNQIVKNEGMAVMNWTYGYDYFEPYMDAEKLTTAMITGEGPEVDVPYSLLKPGANLLMHDREWTAAALEDIVTGLQDKGYEIVDPNLIRTN